uniref:Uncharacterized protein n=1 Tax=Arundo donax TaxID=35708 RepID=A0A0A9E146_ARUDO
MLCDPLALVEALMPPPMRLLPETALLAPLLPKLSARLPFPVPSSLAAADRIPLPALGVEGVEPWPASFSFKYATVIWETVLPLWL